MGAYMSTRLVNEMAEDLASNPLKPGEFRRIKKMGGLTISLETERQEKKWLFQLDINGEDFYIFGFPES